MKVLIPVVIGLLVVGCGESAEKRIAKEAAKLRAPALANEKVAVFLENHCLDCHDRESAKGDLVLEDFHRKQDLRTLFDVYDQAILEYMPPEKKKQPTTEERKAFVDQLEEMLKAKGHDRTYQEELLHARQPTPHRLWCKCCWGPD